MLRRHFLLLFLVSITFPALAQKDSAMPDPALSPSLRLRLTQAIGEDSVDLVLAGGQPKQLRGWGARIVQQYGPANSFYVRIKSSGLGGLLGSRLFRFADLYQSPKEELTTGSLDIATNKANYAHRVYQALRGDGLLTSVKENLFDTTDIDFTHRYRRTATPSSLVTAHASIMATTIAGAANSSPYAQGVADRSRVTSANFASLLPEPDSLFNRHSITVQNHSYGTAMQNYYGVEAAAYDVSARNNPALLHVFSSGNAGAQTSSGGLYTGIAGMANMTGNFKMAKNIITVGAIDSFYHVSPMSSKGPAYDGRVKPELVAFGEDGSSGAAAMVSGSAVLVQQAYQIGQGRLASSAVVKAALVNSADDVGAAGIDFSSGYGSLNTFKAVQTVVEQRVWEDTLAGNGVIRFSLPVPPGAHQVKLTLTWIDPAAEPNTFPALINDLDLVVKHEPSGSLWQPWVLSTVAHADSLQQPARRGRDTLNNVEQVTINNPVAGTYTVEVSASRLQGARQPFAVAYEIDTLSSFYWTFPTQLHGLEGGRSNVLRWTSNIQGSGSLEYKTGAGNWQFLADVPDLQASYYKWDVPDTLASAQVRMRLASAVVASDSFVISRATDLYTGFNCADSFLLYWDGLPVAQYQLYTLRDGYLQPFKATPDTFAVLKKTLQSSLYYSVAPVVAGRPGGRSFILNYAGQGTECYFKGFYLQRQDTTTASFAASLGSVYNVAALSFQKLQGEQFKTLQTVASPSATAFTFTDPALARGVNKYRLQITLSGGQVIYSSEVAAYHFVQGDVIVYPNPVRQQEPVNILTSLAGRQMIQVYSETGALIYSGRLKNLVQQIPAHKLSKGLYIIKVIGDDGATSYQKLVVL
jgi:hypothetical protein